MLSSLTETNRRFEIVNATFKDSAIPMFWCDSKQFIICNAAFQQITEYDEDKLLELGFDNLSFEPGKQEPLNKIFQHQQRDFKIITWVLQTATGKSVSLELRLTQLFVGESKYYYGVLRNLSTSTPQAPVFSEEKESLKIALQASNQGLWEWNAATDETFYSKEYFEILGYDYGAFEPNYDVWANMLHPDDVDKATATWDDFVATQKDTYQDEFRLKKNNEEYTWVSTMGKVISRDSTGEPLRVIGIVQDINSRKLNEIKIQQQTQKLIDYAFFNSHQLRAPLSSIMGLAELLKHEYTPEIVKSLETVSHQLDSVIHEINQVLVGDSFNYKLEQHTPVKKITLVDNDKVLHVVYKKTIERYTENVEIAAYERAKQILELLQNKTLNTDLILVDTDSKFDVWSFLNEFDNFETQIPVYLLAKNIELSDTIRASNYNCVKGILLKPIDRKAFVNFISQINN